MRLHIRGNGNAVEREADRAGVVKSASDKWGTLRLQQRAENLLRRQGQIGKMNTDRVGKRVSDGRREGDRGDLSRSLGAEGPIFLLRFDMFVDKLERHIEI